MGAFVLLLLLRPLLQLDFQVGLHIRQALQQQGVERSALTVQDHLHGFFVGEGFFVAAFAGQCIVHIGQRDQLCADGDLIALQPIRVAAPVPAGFRCCGCGGWPPGHPLPASARPSG